MELTAFKKKKKKRMNKIYIFFYLKKKKVKVCVSINFSYLKALLKKISLILCSKEHLAGHFS